MHSSVIYFNCRAGCGQLLTAYVKILLVILIFVNTYVNGLDVHGRYYGTTAFDSAEDIVYDSASEVAYITGYTNGTLQGFSNNGSSDIVVMKVNTNTNALVWALQYGSTAADQGSGIAYLASQNRLYVTGFTRGALPGLAPAPVFVTGFLLYMNPSNGSIIWSSRVGYNNTQGFKVAVDSSTGIIYVVGITAENLVVNNVGTDSFIMKFDPNGTRIWTAQLVSLQVDYLQSIVVDPYSDAVYAAGTSNSPKFIASYDNVGGYDLVAVKIKKTSGAMGWVSGIGSTADDGAVGLTLNPEGSILIATGYIKAQIPSYPYQGGIESITVAFNTTNGTYAWVRTDGTTQDDAAQAVTSDSSYIYVVGYTEGALYGMSPVGARDAFMLVYNFSGVRQDNMLQFGSDSDDFMRATSGSLQSKLFVAGYSSGNLPGGYQTLGGADMTLFTIAVPSTSPTPSASPSTGASPSVTPSASPSSSIFVSPSSSASISPSAGAESSSSSGAPVALLAGVVGAVGGAVIVAGVAGLVFWRLKKRQKVQSDDVPTANVEMNQAPDAKSVVFDRRNTLIAEEHRKYVIKYSEIVLGDQLGAGAFGIVFKGTWRAQQVAVKKVKEDMIGPDTGSEFKDFLMEALVMMRLKPHKNITTLYAVCLSPLCIVTEFVENGSLEKYLLRKAFTMTELISLLRDISAGMTHLAAEGVVHKDLAARNVLITASGSAKIADFGLARNIQEKHYSSSEIGPLRWMSPENLLKKEFSEKSDVWSFAATAVEIFTKKIPYPAMDTIVVTREVMNGTLRPEIPTQVDTKDGVSQVPEKVSRLVTQCGSYDTDKRPTFAEIVEMLNDILGFQETSSIVYPQSSGSGAYQNFSTNSNSNNADNEYNNTTKPTTVKQQKHQSYNNTGNSSGFYAN